MTKFTIALAAVLCSSTLLTFANESAPIDERTRHIFNNFDKNQDGGISLDEYKTGMNGKMNAERIPVVFKQKDKNSDGQLTIVEMLVVPSTPVPAQKQDDKKKDDKKKEKK